MQPYHAMQQHCTFTQKTHCLTHLGASWGTPFVLQLARALDAALLVLQPAMGLKRPVSLDWCLSQLCTVSSTTKGVRVPWLLQS